tara:strand:+ start:61 stop:501 length:441 start_codon:yes stop_codon:yes gene_type:complete
VYQLTVTFHISGIIRSLVERVASDGTVLLPAEQIIAMGSRGLQRDTSEEWLRYGWSSDAAADAKIKGILVKFSKRSDPNKSDVSGKRGSRGVVPMGSQKRRKKSGRGGSGDIRTTLTRGQQQDRYRKEKKVKKKKKKNKKKKKKTK